jgi:hypothetical protein
VVDSPPLPPDPVDADVDADELVESVVLGFVPDELAEVDVLAAEPPSRGPSWTSSNSQAAPRTTSPARLARANHPVPTFRIPDPPRRV